MNEVKSITFFRNFLQKSQHLCLFYLKFKKYKKIVIKNKKHSIKKVSVKKVVSKNENI